MMTKLCWIFFFSCLLLPVMKADVLDDYEMELAKTAQTTNYRNAINAPESRFAKDYEKSLAHLISLGRKLDDLVNRTLPGCHFSFHTTARDIASIYKFNAEKMRNPENYRKNRKKSNKKNRKKKDLKNILQDPASLFKLLLFDIKYLRSIGFSEENATNIYRKGILSRHLLNFRHTLSSFTSFRGQYFRRRIPESFRQEFDKRLVSLNMSARQLQDSIMRYAGKGASPECNIATETHMMINHFKNYRKLVLENRRGSGKNTTATYLREIRYSLQKIEKALSVLARSGLEGYSSPARPVTAKGKKALSAYNKASRETLEKELLKRRREIYKANTLMEGVDKVTLRKYLMTLTREEKSLYDSVRKERIAGGYTADSATRTAILAIESRNRISADKKLLVSLLEKLDREEAKLKENLWK